MASVTLEEYELLGDAKYRSYVSAVDKVLKNFEYTSEWADLISALGKLNKVLLNHLKYPVIPRRIVISKRLAQCLHPALPSGVHLKALETYDIVFKCIGTNRLSQELFIYSAGLFPLLGNAAMNVRPALLNIYENHFVPLAERLRPGLSGFLTGVLSGLEEGSEYHERTNALLEKVCEGVHQSFFYGCLWECVLTNPSVRLPAVSFVLAHFNKKQSMEDQLHIMGTNVDVLVKALCAAVQDNSVLVQRSVLDLLLLGFPMHNSQLIRSDMECIQTAAVGVVLRRDMSLNRRLYAWLLGTEVNMAYLPSADKPRCNSVASSESGNINLYFDTYSRDLLVEALRTCLKGHKTAWGHSGPDLRPYRILISLLDKPEIGSVILDDVLVEVFRALYHEGASQKAELNELETKQSSSCSSASSRTQKNKGGSGADGKSYSELLKTANLLFGTLEPYYIWEYVGILFSRACAVLSDPQQEDNGVREVGQGSPTVLEICLLIEYLLEVVTIETYVEIQTEHLPELLRSLVSSLGSHCMVLSPSELTASLRLCSRILTKVQPPPVAAGGNSDEKCALSRSVSRETLMLEDTRESTLEAETTPRVAFSPAKENVTVMTEGAAIGGHGDAPTAEGNCLSDAERSYVEQCTSSPDVCVRRTLVHSCVQVFEDFFVQLASRRLFRNHKDYEVAFKRLVVPRQESDSERKQRLERLLKRCLGAEELDNTSSSSSSPSHDSLYSTRTSSSTSSNCPREQSYTHTVQQCYVDTVSSVSELTKAFSYACQMLVEFSSFPMYCKQSPSTQVVMGRKHSSDESSLPDWLQILLVTAAYVREIELQFVSIATLLDLITITRSVVSERQSKPATNSSNWSDSSPQGTVAVVIVPLLEIGYLDFLDNSTCFYQVVSHQLWQLLGQRSLCYHRRTAELLHQLHSLSPNDNLVEDVIGHSMAQGEELLQVEAFRRFAVFWHLIRDLPTKMSWMGTVRMYDRCLFVMLDCLHQDIGPQRIEVQSWLTHSLQRGDAARLLEPLLFVLLDSDTARVSVQHVSIQRPCKVRLAENEDDGSSSEAKIYAISSVEGHIFYHVSDEPRQAVAVSGSRNPRRVFALTSLTGESSSQVVTANAGVTDFDLPSSHERGVRTPILLFINPIGGIAWNEDLESSSMPDLSNVRRIDTSCLRQEFSFDDIDTSTENRGSSSDENRTNICDEHQTSTCEENLTSTCEETQTPICDETKELTSIEIVESILDELISTSFGHQDDAPSVSPSESGSGDGIILEDPGPMKLSESSSSSSSDVHFGRSIKSVSDAEDISIHPLHTHLLLYWQVYDSQRVLYSFNVLRSLVQANPRLALCTLSSCSLSSARSPRHSQLHNLLARHRRSMFGKGFHGDLPAEAVTAFRSNMLLEILISVSLYFVRSFYPNLAQMRLTEEELSGNREVQLAAVELLNLLLSELVPIVKGGARGFASYIYDVLSRCRVQKTLLHCLLSTVYAASKQQPKDVPVPSEKNSCESTGLTFTEAILDFNEVPHSPQTAMSDTCKEASSDYSESFQVCVLRLLLVLIILEDEVTIQKGSDRDSVKTEPVDRARSGSQQQQPQGSTVRYQQGLSIPCQPMFLTAILCALKQQRTRPLHRHWLALVTSALPFLGKSLSHIVITIINQLCQNLEMLAAQYQQKPSDVLALSEISGAPVDYVMTLLDGLTTLCHYCVLDSSSQLSTVLTQPHIMSVQNPNMPEPVHAGQIISNLINVFTPSTIQRDLGSNRDSAPPVDPLIAARRSLLSHLPRLVSALSTMWQAMLTAEKASAGEQHPCWIMGTPKAVKQRILEFLSPISHHHGLNFMAAIAVAWTEKRKKGPISTKKVIPASSEKQLVLVNLVSAIKVMPMDTLVQTVRQVIKQPPPTNSAAAKVIPLEVSMLQFFYSYVQTMTGSVLLESWPSLLGLLKEGLQLGLVPPAQFLLLGILNEFVQHAPMPEDKKDQKDLQDIAQKLIEAVSAVAGACLEQTTWLRRSLAVRPGPQPDMPDSDSELDELSSKSNIELKDPIAETAKKNNSGRVVPSSDASQYSVQALSILAELLAPMLDVIYVSDEKEKVVPLLNNIMYNVTPYLRNHSQHNIPSFRACSVLLASLSGYQYTRKAWRRDALELLLDPSFFQITEACLGYWQTTVDNLMTHDRSTFRDLMARVAMTQSGSLNLFSSKEQEWEQRAQLLKRVAFVIFSGEVDQYQNCMPEIHERLSESLRLPQVPSVQSQVFLCFRVLLLRMSPQHITSLWPIIITEMVQVFLQIEQELNTDSEAFRCNSSSHLRRLSTLDSSWVVSSNNGLNAHNHPAWLQLYLAVCKLLDLALALPAERLPQFQMYRWAFVGEGNALSPTTNNNNINGSKQSLGIGSSGAAHPGFVPHIIRLAQLLNKKVSTQEKLSVRPGHPLLNVTNLKSLLHLQPFFHTLVSRQPASGIPPTGATGGTAFTRQASDENTVDSLLTANQKVSVTYIEKIVQRDFLESMAVS